MTVKILIGDCREKLAELPDESVQMCVTSPPYYGLRDYQTGTWAGGDADCNHVVDDKAKRLGENLANSSFSTAGGTKKAVTTPPIQAQGQCPHCGATRTDRQIGLEPSLPDYIASIVDVMRDVRRVLRKDGVLWLNLGDSYAGGARGGYQGGRSGLQGSSEGQQKARLAGTLARPASHRTPDFKEKDLMQVPARVAIALQDDGWWLRSDTIWFKPNPMPESCRDRPTSAHEHLFLLAKSGDTLLWRHRDTREWITAAPAPDYRWRHKGGRELLIPPMVDGAVEAGWSRINLWRGQDYFYDNEAVLEPFAPKSVARYKQDINGQAGSARAYGGQKTMKAVRKRGVPPYHAQYESSGRDSLDDVGRGGGANLRNVWEIATQPFRDAHFAVFPARLAEVCIRLGSRPGDTVLDPFGGAGTVGLVADQLQRHAVLVELNPDYAAMAEKRIAAGAGIFSDVAAPGATAPPPAPQGDFLETVETS